MIYNSDPGNAPYDDYTEGVSEKGQNGVLAFMDTLSGMLREMFPRCPRFMTDSLWGYIPGVLLAMFLIALVQALARGLDISCGCFGVDESETGARGLVKAIVRDIALFAPALWLALRPCSPRNCEEEQEERK